MPVNGQQQLLGFGDFVMTSASSQCCGGCGYRFPVTCIPIEDFGRRKRSISERDIEQEMVSILINQGDVVILIQMYGKCIYM